jgi:hypothetical protein
LLRNGHFPSIGARFPGVVYPLMPGETTALQSLAVTAAASLNQ